MFLQPDLFDTAEPTQSGVAERLNLPDLIERIADASPRPRYAFMVLNLIAKVANNNNGSAGPYVVEQDRRIPLRDWLCDSLVPMAKRDARRLAIVEEVRGTLTRTDERLASRAGSSCSSNRGRGAFACTPIGALQRQSSGF